MRILIRGDGVAAYCCAYLLGKAGFPVDLEPVDRPRLPVILLGDQALALIRDIFDQPGLFADLPRIRKRVVAWGSSARPIAVEHSAVTVSEEALLDAIRPGLNPAGGQQAPWTIFAARPVPAPVIEHRFGSRMATAAAVTLKESSDPAACWIESLERGWLFLVPGWLLSVGAPAEALLAGSRVIGPEIQTVARSAREFPCYARIASPLCAPGWLACGTAAMAFDPICGDGTAHAIREAILASAVIRGLAKGGNVEELLGHYEARLTAGFRRHLSLCRQFYLSGGPGVLWKAELDAIDRGIQWSDVKLAAHTSFRYQLRGFELEAVR
ncbi:MAG: hypothetical protein ABSH31_13715 [Bryobacteraceae bacterium]